MKEEVNDESLLQARSFRPSASLYELQVNYAKIIDILLYVINLSLLCFCQTDRRNRTSSVFRPSRRWQRWDKWQVATSYTSAVNVPAEAVQLGRTS